MSSGRSVRHTFVFFTFLSFCVSAEASASGPVELISRAHPPSAPQVLGNGFDSSVSADGRYVAFLSTSPNLVAGQSDGSDFSDVFLWDRVTGAVALVSRSSVSPTRAGNAPSITPKVSSDGNWVAFTSQATDLVPGQVDGFASMDVFLWSRATGSIVLVSRSAASAVTAGNAGSFAPSISADGAYVAFHSTATDLVSGQTDANSLFDVFLYDRGAGTTALVSHASGTPATAGSSSSGAPAVSADGRYVAYTSESTDLVAGQTDGNSMNDVFLYDRTAGTSVLVSHASGSATTAGNGFCVTPRISADGNWVAYVCNSSDLVAGQTGGNISNVFLYDRAAGTSVLASHASGSLTSGGDVESGEPSISADGAYVAYHSLATDLVAGQTDANGVKDVFLFDRLAGTSVLVSGANESATATADGGSYEPILSSDGGRVAFTSGATNLVSNQSDTNGVDDIFVYTRGASDLRVVSHKRSFISIGKPALPVQTGNGPSTKPALDASGSHIAFTSLASDLTEESDTNGASDVFDFTWAGESVVPLSFSPPVTSVTGDSFSAMNAASALSADGRYVAFFSWAGNLIPGLTDANGETEGDIYLQDRVAGTTTLASRSAASAITTGNRHSQQMALSADGAYVVFESYSTDIVPGLDPGPPFGDPDIFLFDRAAGTNVLVSHAPGAPTQSAEGTSHQPVISADGGWVVFSNLAGNVVSGLTEGNAALDLFLYSRASGESVLVSRNSASPAATGNGPSEMPAVSADGRYVAFLSTASDLVAGQTMNNADYNVFLFDRVAGTTTLVSHASSSATATGNGGAPSAQPLYRPAISADGAWVAFTSRATDLVSGQADTNSGDDVFLWERATGTIRLVSRASASAALAGDEASDSPSISADGRYIAFHGDATDLVPGQADTNLAHDVFLYDRVTGSTSLVSHAAGSETAAGGGFSFQPVISANGLAVAFHSDATDLVAGLTDAAASIDLFLYDRPSGTTRLLSHAGGSPQVTANAGSGSPQISADGGTVAFNSFASDLVAGDYNQQTDVFVHSRAGLDYHALAPCRLLDTRTPQDAPALTSGVTEVFVLTGACGIPAHAKAVALNVTAVETSGEGYLAMFPGDFLRLPVTSAITFPGAGAMRSNNVIIPLAGDGTGSVLVHAFVAGGGAVHVVLDVAGYFAE